jgi:hypothetical protein
VTSSIVKLDLALSHSITNLQMISGIWLGIFLLGCRANVVPTTRIDLVNGRFEQDSIGWRFYFDESHGKVIKDGGLFNSGRARLVVTPSQRLDGFSQSLPPFGATSIEVSAYVLAKGRDIKATVRIECRNPNLNSEEDNYGQLAKSESDPCPLNSEWTMLKASVTIPQDTVEIRVFGCVQGTDGEASFDDFVVERR